jgi:hypothetical protein
MPLPAFLAGPFTTVIRMASGIALDHRKVRVLVHAAHLLDAPDVECAFVNVTNLSRNREVSITHVWFVTRTGRVDVINADRPLPRRLVPDETWETWVRLSAIDAPDPYTAARVRLSTGDEIESRRNPSVQPAGHVPG